MLGHPALPSARLERAPAAAGRDRQLGGLSAQRDYAAALDRGGTAQRQPGVRAPGGRVALGCDDLARGISATAGMRACLEAYCSPARGCVPARGIPWDRRLRRPRRRCTGCWRRSVPVKLPDPCLPIWSSPRGASPASRDEVLSTSRVSFASRRYERKQWLPRPRALAGSSRERALSEPRGRRGLRRAGRAGCRRAVLCATYVPGRPSRRTIPSARSTNAPLPHRAGGIARAFLSSAAAVTDRELVRRGLPPAVCNRAERDTAAACAPPGRAVLERVRGERHGGIEGATGCGRSPALPTRAS